MYSWHNLVMMMQYDNKVYISLFFASVIFKGKDNLGFNSCHVSPMRADGNTRKQVKSDSKNTKLIYFPFVCGI
jgi:hypothetical protein